MSLHLLPVFSVLSNDEVLLGPEVMFGPPGVILSCPVAMTISHCADVSEDWSVRLKRQTHGDSWEVWELYFFCIMISYVKEGRLHVILLLFEPKIYLYKAINNTTHYFH